MWLIEGLLYWSHLCCFFEFWVWGAVAVKTSLLCQKPKKISLHACKLHRWWNTTPVSSQSRLHFIIVLICRPGQTIASPYLLLTHLLVSFVVTLTWNGNFQSSVPSDSKFTQVSEWTTSLEKNWQSLCGPPQVLWSSEIYVEKQV